MTVGTVTDAGPVRIQRVEIVISTMPLVVSVSQGGPGPAGSAVRRQLLGKRTTEVTQITKIPSRAVLFNLLGRNALIWWVIVFGFGRFLHSGVNGTTFRFVVIQVILWSSHGRALAPIVHLARQVFLAVLTPDILHSLQHTEIRTALDALGVSRGGSRRLVGCACMQ